VKQATLPQKLGGTFVLIFGIICAAISAAAVWKRNNKDFQGAVLIGGMIGGGGSVLSDSVSGLKGLVD